MDRVNLFDVLGVKSNEGSIRRRVEVRVGQVCKKCPLRKSVYVPPEDVGEPKFLVVGEAPGRTEREQKRPFVGQSGQLLRRSLELVGYGYRIVNAVMCYPADKQGNPRTPTSKEIEVCKSRLQEQMEGFDVVLLLGGVAVSSVLGSDVKLGRVIGHVCRFRDKKIICAYHPAYFIRRLGVPKDVRRVEDKEFKDWLETLLLVRKVLTGQTEDLGFEIKDLDYAPPQMVLDLETESLESPNVLAVGCMDLEKDKEVLVGSGEKLAKIKDVQVLVMHNAKFDYQMLMKNGIDVSKVLIRDTMLMAFLVDPKRRFSGFNLKDLGKKYLGYRYRNLVVGDWPTSFTEVLRRYNAEDVFLTKRLYDLFWHRLLSDKQREFVDKVLSNAVKVISEIEMTGMKVDRDRVERAMKECQEKSRELLADLQQIGEKEGYTAINWDSPKQVGLILDKLARREGIELPKTPSGQISTRKEVLLDLLYRFNKGDFGRFLDKFLKYRQYQKEVSTFWQGIVKYLGPDDRIRSNYDLIGTVTGRLSSSSPNLQNIPKEVRHAFVPEKGYKFIEADLSQIELRIAAIIANEQVMKQIYREGRDIHRFVASRVAGIPEEQVTSEQRRKAKPVSFGFLYGMQWQAFQAYAKTQYGVEYDDFEAQEHRAKFFELFPGLERWHREAEEIVRTKGWVESPFGRVYVFEGGDVGSLVRRAVNYPVQGTASDLNLYIMGQIFEWKVREGIDCRFVGTVHDSMILEVREDVVDLVLAKIKEVVKNLGKVWSWIDIPIEMEAEVKESWKE